MKNMTDRTGLPIRSGDVLQNVFDKTFRFPVIRAPEGHLFLGDFDSPLERFEPQKWWRVSWRDGKKIERELLKLGGK